MNVTPETIAEAIAHHAVLLNRVQWLDPARADLQRDIWLHYIERSGETGLLIIEDFAYALDQYSEVPHVADVTVLKLIASAIGRAARRAEEAAAFINAAPNMLFYEALAKYEHKVSCADSPAAQDAADIWLDAEVEHTQIMLMTSGYPDEVTGPVIAEIEAKAIKASAGPKPFLDRAEIAALEAEVGGLPEQQARAEAIFDIDNYADMDD